MKRLFSELTLFFFFFFFFSLDTGDDILLMNSGRPGRRLVKEVSRKGYPIFFRRLDFWAENTGISIGAGEARYAQCVCMYKAIVAFDNTTADWPVKYCWSNCGCHLWNKSGHGG